MTATFMHSALTTRICMYFSQKQERLYVLQITLLDKHDNFCNLDFWSTIRLVQVTQTCVMLQHNKRYNSIL